jgi:nicotinate-nucleotide adenylyltransferase
LGKGQLSLLNRIGLLGGSFDPPHRAHEILAREAVAQLKLDRLYIVPTGQAWHKSRVLSDAVHRLAMARLAFDACPQTVVDEMEILREGPSFTIQTLSELQARHPQAVFFLVVGQDQAASFSQWHEWQEILQIAQLVVVARPMISSETAAAREWHNLNSERVIQMHMPLMGISSSELRASYALGHTQSDFVSPLVADYIQQNQLYLEPHDRSR